VSYISAGAKAARDRERARVYSLFTLERGLFYENELAGWGCWTSSNEHLRLSQ